VPNSTIRRGLFEQSEFPSHKIRCWGGVHPQGQARANMVLGTFAKTKVPRRAGAKPRIKIQSDAVRKNWITSGLLTSLGITQEVGEELFWEQAAALLWWRLSFLFLTDRNAPAWSTRFQPPFQKL